MPIQNLGRVQSGSVYVDRSVEAVRWLPIDTYTSKEGGPAKTYAVKDYLRGDVNTVVTQGSFNSSVFSTTGTNLDMVVTATPRAAVTDDAQVLDNLVLRATGITVNSVTPAAVDGTISVVTFGVPEERIYWVGTPGRTVNESTNITIPLVQFIQGTYNNDFDSITLVSTTPNTSYITVENGTGNNKANAALRVNAPGVSVTTNINVVLRVTKSTATPTTDDITFTITVLDLTPTADAGISVVRWDMPDMPISAGTFNASVFFDQALGESDTLVPGDFYIDGFANSAAGVQITAVAVDGSDNKKYNLSLSAAQNINGILTIGLVK